MNRFLRALTTIAVAFGMILLFSYYTVMSSQRRADAFQQPSFFEMQNYLYLFLSGIICLGSGLISCFMAWLKSMDKKVEVLPNAISAQGEEVIGWVSGSTLDTTLNGGTLHNSSQREVANKTVSDDDETLTATQSHDFTQSSSDETVAEMTERVESADGDKTVSDIIVTEPLQRNVVTARKNKQIALILAGIGIVVLLSLSGFLFSRINHSISKEGASDMETETVEGYTENSIETSNFTEPTVPRINAKYINGIWDAEIDGLSIHIENDREFIITLSGIDIQDTYLTNKSDSKENFSEYLLSVSMYGDQVYTVETGAYAHEPGKNEYKSIDEFGNSVITYPNMDYSESIEVMRICEPEMTHTTDSITWRFSIPAQYMFDFSDMNYISVDELGFQSQENNWISYEIVHEIK